MTTEDIEVIAVEQADKQSRRKIALANRKIDPMRIFYAVQRKLPNGRWDTTKLFYTRKLAQAYIDRTADGLRIEETEREIND